MSAVSEQYNKAYYDQYDVGVGKVNYENSEYTKDFLEKIAEHIVDDLHPKTVLDAGCAMGHLVAALRDRGVEAYGVDISEYAISKVREDVKPYCAVGSLTDPLPGSFPKHFDLVTSIEVLEHLYAQEGNVALKNLCALTDCIIFSSTPDDFTEPTHVNVQQREYWARLFAEAGFYDDLNYRPGYLSPQALCFRRNTDWLRQVEDYERTLRVLEGRHISEINKWAKAVEDKECHIQNQNAILDAAQQRQAELERDLAGIDAQLEQQKAALEQERTDHAHQLAEVEAQKEDMEKEISHYRKHYLAAIGQRDDLERQLAAAQNAYQTISNAACWKLTKPLRVVLDFVKRALRSNRCTRMLCKGLKCMKENGFRYTRKKIKDKLRHRQDFQALAARPLYTPQELEAQRSYAFSKDVKVSIVVPLYNTPQQFLHEMIQSVLDQTYGNWELCMADGSDEEHAYVGRICRDYAKKDKRVVYHKLAANKGISENTNACIELATGDYIGLLDHDDLLHPAALFDVMRAICEQGADFIYTDENTFRHKPQDAYCPHFKPDFAPDTLRANNYICHFTVFQRTLLDELGEAFRPKCDGSQDFDLVLRLTEKAKKVVHIPKILYYWRAHANSVADSVGAKPYVIEAAHRALQDHLERVGLKGEVLDTVVPSMYRIRYEIKGEPLVSILIPNKDHVEDLKKCLESIFRKSTYSNFEIIIAENNSETAEIFDYYQQIQKKWPNVRVVEWKDYFNYSAINNFGAKYAQGAYLLLLNSDTEIISPDWIQEMLMFAQRNDVGAVGAKLYYPDDTVQHAGIGIGLLTLAGHYHRGFDRNHPGYMGRLIYAQDVSAVTAACVMLRRDVWDKIGGLDESFEVAFNDVDMCMRIRQAGFLIVWTPFAELYHYESKSRGLDDTPEKRKRFEGEVRRFQTRWAKELAVGDPYYNPNFSLDREDFSLR